MNQSFLTLSGPISLLTCSKDDFYRILTEPEANMIKQHQALLAAEGISLHFTDAAIQEISRVAEDVNTNVDNIGARRLHTILERIVEDISFEAPEKARATGGGGVSIVVDAEDVQSKIEDLLKKQDLSKYVL